MIEYAKIVLWGVSFYKNLFRKELNKIIGWSDHSEYLQLKKYCYNKYYDIHPEIIDEVFAYNKKEYARVTIPKNYKHPQIK